MGRREQGLMFSGWPGSRFLPSPADRCLPSPTSSPTPERLRRESGPPDPGAEALTLARLARSRACGASRKGAVALATHSPRSPCRRILPFACRVRASQVLIGESHNSLAGFASSFCTLRPRRFASCRLQSQMWVSRSSLNRATLSIRFLRWPG